MFPFDHEQAYPTRVIFQTFTAVQAVYHGALSSLNLYYHGMMNPDPKVRLETLDGALLGLQKSAAWLSENIQALRDERDRLEGELKS